MGIVVQTVEVPARTRKEVIVVCDDCGAEAWSKCTQCEADICRDHREVSPSDSGGDYTDYVCSSCLEIMQEHQHKVDDLEKTLDKLVDDIQLLCIQKRKKKNEANKT